MPKKRYQGAVNDKERSMAKLIEAVGTIIKTEGYTALGPTNIAKCAGLNKRLIYFYFGTVDHLIETYVRGKDYWVAAAGNAEEVIKKSQNVNSRELLETLLINHLDYFYKEEEMQKIILWQISQKTKLMFDVCEEREKHGEQFFALAEPDFKGTNVDLRAIAGLLVGGIYYMILHAKSSDSLFCNIDLNSSEGIDRVKKAIASILKDTYDKAIVKSKEHKL